MEFLSSSEIAKRWGVSERSVRNYCASGRVPGAVQAGKTWIVPAGAAKPARANGRSTASPLLTRLREEKDARVRGGIYHKAQIDLTYNSNHIEGSRLTCDQTRLIFETRTILPDGNAVSVDDIVETVNHFRAIDYVIDNAERPLDEAMIRKLHGILKAGTSDADLPWFGVGEYKKLPNEVAERATTAPEEVPAAIGDLLESYGPRRQHSLEDLLAFHVGFERIHPFQDGNGRVGRLILFKECLANGITPFVIADDMKAFYYRGLAEWDDEPGFLTDTCHAAQDRFEAALAYFRVQR